MSQVSEPPDRSGGDDGYMVPNRRKSGRRTLLDGSLARRKLRRLAREYCIWDRIKADGPLLGALTSRSASAPLAVIPTGQILCPLRAQLLPFP